MASPQEEKEGEAESSSPIDWGEIFSDLVCHTSITDSEIPYMSLPKIQAYRKGIGKNIPLKVGITSLFGGGMTTDNEEPQGEATQEDVEAFFNDF